MLARQAGALKRNLLVIPESLFCAGPDRWLGASTQSAQHVERSKHWRALARALVALAVMDIRAIKLLIKFQHNQLAGLVRYPKV